MVPSSPEPFRPCGMTPSLSHRGCPACTSDTLQPWSREGDNTILRCAHCGTTSFPRPLAKSHDYGTYYTYLKIDEARRTWDMNRRRPGVFFQLEEIERLAPGPRTLLDFGAGPGFFCALARERGWTIKAIEASADAVAVGKHFSAIPYVDDLDAVEAESLSVVTAFHVLEHVEDPEALLEAFHGKLQPRGLLVVHVPNAEPLSTYCQYLLQRARGRRAERKGSLYFPEHVTGFTLSGLKECARRAGFEPVRLQQCSLFSKYHWPLDFREYRLASPSRARAAVNFGKECTWGLVSQVGAFFGRGDWVVGLFRKR